MISSLHDAIRRFKNRPLLEGLSKTEEGGASEKELRTEAGAQSDHVRFLSLRIVDYDELPARLETRAQILDASVGWMPLDFRRMERARRIGFPAAPYFGVYAVENDEILSTVRVMRIPYTLANGSVETVSGIQGVITRREWSRRGLARKLLAEVHRREAEAGLGFVMLWTGHSLMAHNLYNSMGYQDIYTPNLAIRKCDGRRARPRGYELKTARRSDSELIEKLHSDSTAGRVGFTPRPKGIVSILFKLWLKPDSFRLILRGGKPIGYAQMQKGRGWVKAEELILSEAASPQKVMELLESEASRGWLILFHTFVRDRGDMLRRRGFVFTDHAYFGLMAKPLSGSHRDVSKELGTTNDSFTCHSLDYF